MAQRFQVLNGDSLKLLHTLEPNSIHSCVCDPPYELGFMGKKWDSTGIANNVQLWESVFRVLKPGAHLIAFGGTRTYHRMVCAIEDAGFEIRDQIGWVYGSGFPKSLDVSKAIDKANGAKYSASPAAGVGFMNPNGENGYNVTKHRLTQISEKTEAAKKWQGWGTALKPAWEPIVLARKALIGTVAENVQLHGTGAINIDACRVEANDFEPKDRIGASKLMENRPWNTRDRIRITEGNTNGRWPANVIHDGSEEVLAEFAKANTHSAGVARGGGLSKNGNSIFCGNHEGNGARFGDTGTAARFFYCAKASKRDRDEGLNGFEPVFAPTMGNGIGGKEHDPETATPKRNNHPTVKPTALMRYLCKLITPPGGLILDPFTGSGSTGKAAILEGFRFVGIELSPDYAKIARARISSAHEFSENPFQDSENNGQADKDNHPAQDRVVTVKLKSNHLGVLTKTDKKNTAKPL